MRAARPGELATLYQHMSLASRRQLWLLAILMPATALAEMLMVVAIVPFIAALDPQGGLQGPSTVLPISGIAPATILFIAAAFVATLFRLALSWWSFRLTSELAEELNAEIQRRMLYQPYLFHVSSHSSRLLASLEKVDELVFSSILRGLQFVSAVIISAGVIAALLFIDVLGAIGAMLFVAVLYGAALLLVRGRYRRNAEVMESAHQQRIKLIQENLGGIRDIILDRSQEAHVAPFRAVDGPFMRARAELNFVSTAPRYLVEGAGLGIIALAVFVIAGRPGGLTAALPVIAALALGAQRLLPLASQIFGGWVGIAASRPLLREVNSLLNLPVAVETQQPPPLPFNDRISLEAVEFHYPGRDRPALHGIDLSINRGSRVAIVGRTGSGKSTLADLLMGLVEPNGGQIRVDGALLAGPALAAWRQSVAHVPQSIFLVDASIAHNISIGSAGDPLDMDRIEQAARSAQLHGFIASLPDGYDTRVGEGGVLLSGGQRQRLALARAIYRQPRFLVLDEATSALDEETEADVLASLDGLRERGCTIVIVAHRLSTVERCDRIFMLEEGRLAQSGSFTELFGRINRLQEQGELGA